MARVGVAALAFTPALSGHAASAPQLTALAILADELHVLGVGGWLGSLLLVLVVGLPAAMRLAEDDRGPAVADLINAFSPTALVFAGILCTTGVLAAWLHLGAVSALWQADYGRTLLASDGYEGWHGDAWRCTTCTLIALSVLDAPRVAISRSVSNPDSMTKRVSTAGEDAPTLRARRSR